MSNLEKTPVFERTFDKLKPIPEIETSSVSNGDSTPAVIPKLAEAEPAMPEPPVLFNEVKKNPILQQKTAEDKVEWGIETTKLESDDTAMNKIFSQPISVVQETKVEPKEEEAKVMKSKVVEEKAPVFNIETTTMDAPEIVVPQQPVSVVSAPPPMSPFNKSIKEGSVKVP